MRAPGRTTLQKAPQRPRWRSEDVELWGYPANLTNPKHPAGTDPRNVDVLMRLELNRTAPGTRGR